MHSRHIFALLSNKLLLATGILIFLCMCFFSLILVRYLENKLAFPTQMWKPKSELTKHQVSDVTNWLERTRLPQSGTPSAVQTFVSSSRVNNLFLVVCNTSMPPESSAEPRNVLSRQLTQVSTLLKSLLYFSNSSFRIGLITDSDATYHSVLVLLDSWPQQYKDRVLFERGKLWYPPNPDDNLLLQIWRPCAWSKMFLHESLPTFESGVFLDTDTVFMGPADGLWDYSLPEPQVMAVPDEPLYHRHLKVKIRLVRGGINTGVMVMNLTRIRHFPGGFAQQMMNAKNEYPNVNDQDVMNALFYDYQDLLGYFPAQWSFSPGQCFFGILMCCIDTGVNLMHGYDGVFFRDWENVFKSIHEVMRGLSFDTKPSTLLEQLEMALYRTDQHALESKCRSIVGLEYVLLKNIKTLSEHENKLL